MRRINANYDLIKGSFNKYFFGCIGAGRAGEILRKDVQDQLQIVIDECGFKYLRFHGIFHDEMAVYKEDKDGNAIYNWQYVDIVYDSILEKGIKPFVEIGFMPKAMASGEQTVFWWEANVTPPKDYNKWYLLVKNFILHLEDRYGREELKTWYYEVWNEPNHPGFFSPTKSFNDLSNIDEYFRLYDITVKAIKEVCIEYRVGGPATAGNGWTKELIDHCFDKKVPIDFVSTHTYGIESITLENGESSLWLSSNKDSIIDDVKRVNNIVKSAPIKNLELHYTEWSSSWYNKDHLHESYVQAPCILYNLKRIEGLATCMSYWTFTDIFEEEGPPIEPFQGGFGLINLQGIKKPAFYAYKFLKELGEFELENDDSDSWICKNEKGIQVLLWNYTKPKQDECDEVYFSRDLPSQQAEDVLIEIEGIPKGSYIAQIYRVGYSCNDPYTEYIRMGKPSYLNREQIKTLKMKSAGEPVFIEECSIEAGGFIRRLKLQENDVYLVKLERIK